MNDPILLQRRIQHYTSLVNLKIQKVQALIDELDDVSEVSEYLDKIKPIVDKLGCCSPTYKLPQLCNKNNEHSV